MNQQQREFLIKQVENTCDEQIEKLEAKIPDKPSLNNYLVAAFLDNSVQFSDIELLKKKMREAVLKFGASDTLIEEKDDYWGSRRRRDRDDKRPLVQVDAEDLFIIPEGYKQAVAAYEKKKAEIESEIDKLKNFKKTIVLKLQIGSSAVLDKLIMQVDNMGDLSLVNTQLLLEGPTKEEK